MAVEDIKRRAKDKGIRYTGHRDKPSRNGTTVAVLRGGKKRPLVYGLCESVKQKAPLPQFK